MGELVLGFWWHINPRVPYKKLMLQGYFLARDHFYICDKFMHGPMQKDEVYLPGYVSGLVGFLKHVFQRSRLNARAYSKVLSPSKSGSGLPYPIPPWTSLYPVQHSLHGHSNLHLGSWQSQHAADQRTGP